MTVLAGPCYPSQNFQLSYVLETVSLETEYYAVLTALDTDKYDHGLHPRYTQFDLKCKNLAADGNQAKRDWRT